MNYLAGVPISNTTKEIFQDDILNISANAANSICQKANLEDKDWERIYNKLIEVLNEILDEPDFRNYN